VFLRYPVPSDRPEYLALRRRSRAFLEPWEPTPQGGPRPFSPVRFDRLLKVRRSGLVHGMLVCERQSGAIMGLITLSGIVRGAFQSAFVGYWIGEEFAGRGYMTEALSLVLGLAFRTLGLHRVEANIVPENERSLRLVKRFGFRYEGTARRYLRINGAWRDHEHWAMTLEEWQKKAGRRTVPPAATRIPARSRAST
jgi:ribosomal-protein-alanine N-acetyltransferase